MQKGKYELLLNSKNMASAMHRVLSNLSILVRRSGKHIETSEDYFGESHQLILVRLSDSKSEQNGTIGGYFLEVSVK